MARYLSKQRDEDVAGSYRRYQEYLRENQKTFPPGGFALGTAEWHQDANDHQSPHDGWLEHITISEPSSGERQEARFTSARIRLLGAYHDGFIEFFYPQVFRYSLGLEDATCGHRDWRYDEFRLSDTGGLVHEIEWSDGATWIIEASDVEFFWIPRERI